MHDPVLPEDRPKQILFNPFPILVTKVKHVDPQTNMACDLRLMTVRDQATNKDRKIRVSTSSGAVFEIPEISKPSALGDPLLDTPFQDATEETNIHGDIDVLAQQKLEALEQHFVGKLKAVYEFYHPMEEQVALDHDKFQWDVWIRAK